MAYATSLSYESYGFQGLGLGFRFLEGTSNSNFSMQLQLP